MSTISYLALGDSYTIGTSVGAEARWPRQLIDRLVAREAINTDPLTSILDIVAVNGWTTHDLLSGIPTSDLLARYDMVSLLIGVNNQFQGLPLTDYREEFATLLSLAVEKAGGHSAGVFVVSIPDYSCTPFGADRADAATGIDSFNTAARRICEELEIAFYDITAISREARTDQRLIAADDLHPSGKQYERWVTEVLSDPVWLRTFRPATSGNRSGRTA